MKILHKIVLQFYLGAFYSVDLSFTGIFLHHILGFYTLFSFISSGTSAESSALTLVLAFHFSAAKQSESPGNCCFSLCICISGDQFQDSLDFLQLTYPWFYSESSKLPESLVSSIHFSSLSFLGFWGCNFFFKCALYIILVSSSFHLPRIIFLRYWREMQL